MDHALPMQMENMSFGCRKLVTFNAFSTGFCHKHVTFNESSGPEMCQFVSHFLQLCRLCKKVPKDYEIMREKHCTFISVRDDGPFRWDRHLCGRPLDLSHPVRRGSSREKEHLTSLHRDSCIIWRVLLLTPSVIAICISSGGKHLDRLAQKLQRRQTR